MLPRRVPSLPEGPEWQYEVKWDGYRMQAIKHNGKVQLLSRNGADYTARCREVARAIARLKPSTLHLDGELVATDQAGKPAFQLLQSRKPLPKGCRMAYYAFDLLQLGRDSYGMRPLAERRKALEALIAGSALRLSAILNGTAEQVIAVVREQGLEGVVAKRLGSFYEPGKRSGAWVKLPCKQTGTFLIGGFRPAGKRLGVVLVGKFDGSRFRFAGKVKHGLDAASRARLLHAIEWLRIESCPFVDLPNVRTDAFDENVTPEEMTSFWWVNPQFEVAVQYSEWTRFGSLRHPELYLEKIV